jgi:thymidylate synthase
MIAQNRKFSAEMREGAPGDKNYEKGPRRLSIFSLHLFRDMLANQQPQTSAPHEELQYLSLIDRIIKTGDSKIDRTKVGTKSVFGNMMRFSLKDNTIPLFTTKKVFWKAIVEELLFFIRGDTNATHLSNKAVHIWDGHSSKEFLASVGLGHREKGDIGPMYGWQWRHAGAKYVDMDRDYTDQGFDQLKDVLDKLKTNPADRRIILCAWNAADLHLMALAPCHVLAQFHTTYDSANSVYNLSCMVTQRSADVGLGVPFNVASYGLLTHLIAHAVGMKASELVYSTGDTHVYMNHILPLKEQLTRTPKPFPKVDLSECPVCVDPIASLEGLLSEDIKLVGYDYHPHIKMEMAV